MTLRSLCQWRRRYLLSGFGPGLACFSIAVSAFFRFGLSLRSMFHISGGRDRMMSVERGGFCCLYILVMWDA